MSATNLTKSGQPCMGSPIEVCLADGTWERCTLVGKGMGVGGFAHTMVAALVEWGDGVRQWLQPWPDLKWRAVDMENGD